MLCHAVPCPALPCHAVLQANALNSDVHPRLPRSFEPRPRFAYCSQGIWIGSSMVTPGLMTAMQLAGLVEAGLSAVKAQ